MAKQQTAHITTQLGNKVRIGPISLITLIIVICMAVLGVLAASTSHANETIAKRQANATQQLYLNEKAGQELVAGIDAVLAEARENGSDAYAVDLVEDELGSICQAARTAGDGRVECTADMEGTTVNAEFICDDARTLNVAVTIRSDATYRIDKWKMASVQQEAPGMGNLWTGA